MVTGAVVLDTGPLGLMSNPKVTPAALECNRWVQGLVQADVRVIVPEIADYELRRELIRAGKASGLARLDGLSRALEYLPITTAAMRLAAELWARARREGQPTAPDAALDGDVILAAQALALGVPDVTIATTNVGHLNRFAPASLWRNVAA